MESEDRQIDYMELYYRPEDTHFKQATIDVAMSMAELYNMDPSQIYIYPTRMVHDLVLPRSHVAVGCHVVGTPRDQLEIVFFAPSSEEE